MSNVRIGPDGSIIKDDEIVESDGRTIIREDGTIESTSVGGSMAAPVRTSMIVTPPVSPLENSSNRNVLNSAAHHEASSLRMIREKEYDIQMQDAKIRAAVPTNMIIATIVLCILGIIGLYFLFAPAVVTGIMIFVGFSKKRELEEQRETMYRELEALKSGIG